MPPFLLLLTFPLLLDSEEDDALVRGYGNGTFEVRTDLDGEVLCEIPVRFMTVWEKYEGKFKHTVTNGKAPLYLTYRGGGDVQLKSFKYVHR